MMRTYNAAIPTRNALSSCFCALVLLAIMVSNCGDPVTATQPSSCVPAGNRAAEVLSPRKGDIYTVGDTMDIAWKLNADSMSGSDITISVEGSEWNSVLMQEETIDPEKGTYQCTNVQWVIYDGYFSSGTNRCILRVKDYTTESNGVSDTFFVNKP